MAGTLYLVATPIGNLEDITFRAARILRDVDLIACEDTRQTRKLLNALGIDKPAISYHEHNEEHRAVSLMERLATGSNIALVSDAGTPLIADPGHDLVSLAIEHGIGIVPIPGPSAAITALSASGLPTDAFYFAGFLPAKAGQRTKALEALKGQRCTTVFYEAPHRILDTLDDVQGVLGNRRVVVARELTKMYEEFLRGTAAEIRAELASRPAVKGEFVVIVDKEEPASRSQIEPAGIRSEVEARIQQGMPRMEAIKAVARAFGMSKREVYRVVTGDGVS